ncbi:unnamed protein product [Linum trigynum]|uniref:Retrotransposon gag domain-containing protein n=1 Tax=Linum trigynum TaxID=586398 RepID=A0AAV2F593_9ROSI
MGPSGRKEEKAGGSNLEFPKYKGNEDPSGWFARVEQFFRFQETPEENKVALASYHMEGDANQWWQWLDRTYATSGLPITWARFREELWARFGLA